MVIFQQGVECNVGWEGMKQDQLLERDCMMLRVTEYFARSFKMKLKSLVSTLYYYFVVTTSVSRTDSEIFSVGVTLKTGSQGTVNTVVPTRSYRVLN